MDEKPRPVAPEGVPVPLRQYVKALVFVGVVAVLATGLVVALVLALSTSCCVPPP
jgi:hypothetical protein